MTVEAGILSRFLRKYAQELGAPQMEETPPGGEEDPLATLNQAVDSLDGQDQQQQQDQTQEQMQQPALPELPEEEEVSPERAQMQRTLYYKFEKWKEVLDNELPKYEYLEKENIEAILSALSTVHKLFEQAISNRTRDFNREDVNEWNDQINRAVTRMHEIQPTKVDRTRAIVDAYMLYGTTNRLFDEFKRVAGHDATYANVLQEFSNAIRVFAQVIKQVPEQVSKEDLTKIR